MLIMLACLSYDPTTKNIRKNNRKKIVKLGSNLNDAGRWNYEIISHVASADGTSHTESRSHKSLSQVNFNSLHDYVEDKFEKRTIKIDVRSADTNACGGSLGHRKKNQTVITNTKFWHFSFNCSILMCPGPCIIIVNPVISAIGVCN